MRRAAALIVPAAAVAAVAVLLLARGGSAPAIEPGAPVAVRAVFDGALPAFGDPVTARVVVAIDRRAVRPQTLQVSDDLAPFTPLAAPLTVRTVSGRLETVSITQRVACLTAPCLARTIALPRVRVSVTARDGTASTASTAWPRVQLRSRVTASDLAASTPRFAADAAPGPPSYRIAPATAETILEVVAALAAAGAAALLALGARALARRRRRPVGGDELTRALRLVREAESRPVPDRRRALELLARLLRRRDGALGTAATELAWSAPPPEPQAVDALVARVEGEQAR